jgi:hypothetical protein
MKGHDQADDASAFNWRRPVIGHTVGRAGKACDDGRDRGGGEEFWSLDYRRTAQGSAACAGEVLVTVRGALSLLPTVLDGMGSQHRRLSERLSQQTWRQTSYRGSSV